MLLQTRGKLTTKKLAEELGVARRTILRDINALSFAGIPIYSEGGHGGGVALDEHYRTTLTGLHTPEIQALFIHSNQVALRDVGLNDASEQLLLKLLAALPATQRVTVNHIRQRLMIDPTWWWHDTQNLPFWDDLQQAVYDDRVIETTYENYQGQVVERVLEPYSLVNKSGLWYLIAKRDGELRTYRVMRFHALRLSDRHFVRDATFDLTSYWQEHLQEFVDSFTEYQCTLRIHPEKVTFIKWLMPGRWDIIEEDKSNGWVTFRLMLDSLVMAKMLVFGLGSFGDIVEPQELRQTVFADAHEIIERMRQQV